jgi:hypothetical protein
MRVWGVKLKASGAPQQVRHPYSEIRQKEVDPATGRTVCSEDQEKLMLPPLSPFSVCSKLAPRVRRAFTYLLAKGQAVRTVVGYRVIRSRGPLDQQGSRTEFSNHSFGTAIDINPDQNGLYGNCATFGPGCTLLRGGAWEKGSPGTLERDGMIVSVLKQEGFLWGGEIAGTQKDFMHFSLTGY